jgi:hypothetical protein
MGGDVEGGLDELGDAGAGGEIAVVQSIRGGERLKSH